MTQIAFGLYRRNVKILIKKNTTRASTSIEKALILLNLNSILQSSICIYFSSEKSVSRIYTTSPFIPTHNNSSGKQIRCYSHRRHILEIWKHPDNHINNIDCIWTRQQTSYQTNVFKYAMRRVCIVQCFFLSPFKER